MADDCSKPAAITVWFFNSFHLIQLKALSIQINFSVSLYKVSPHKVTSRAIDTLNINNSLWCYHHHLERRRNPHQMRARTQRNKCPLAKNKATSQLSQLKCKWHRLAGQKRQKQPPRPPQQQRGARVDRWSGPKPWDRQTWLANRYRGVLVESTT